MTRRCCRPISSISCTVPTRFFPWSPNRWTPKPRHWPIHGRAALARIREEPGTSAVDRIGTLHGTLCLLRARHAAFPNHLVRAVRTAVREAERDMTDPYARMSLFGAAYSALSVAGLYDEAYYFMTREVKRSHSPDYVMLALAGSVRCILPKHFPGRSEPGRKPPDRRPGSSGAPDTCACSCSFLPMPSAHRKHRYRPVPGSERGARCLLSTYRQLHAPPGN